MNEFYRPNVLNITVDLGKKGNNAAWYWYWDGRKPVIVNYKDDHYNNYELIKELPKLYPDKVFNLILPADANQPVFEGDTAFIKLNQFIKDNFLDRIVNINVLSKTKPNKKIELIKNGIDLFRKAVFLPNEDVKKGIRKLSGTVHPVNKDGYINQKKFLENGMQHAADAWCYVAGSIDEGYANNLNSAQIETIDGISNMQSINSPLTHYKGFKIC